LKAGKKYAGRLAGWLAGWLGAQAQCATVRHSSATANRKQRRPARAEELVAARTSLPFIAIDPYEPLVTVPARALSGRASPL
jgi:hypothetical protein